MSTFKLKLLSYFKGLNCNLAHSWKNYKIIYFYVYVLFPHICLQWPSGSIIFCQKQKSIQDQSSYSRNISEKLSSLRMFSKTL